MDYIKIPVICIEAVLALTVPERGRLLGSLLRYIQGSEEGAEEPRGNEYSLYLVLKAQMDKDMIISKKRAEAGRAGGSASKPKQTEANVSKCKQNFSPPPSLPSPPTLPVSISPSPKEKPPKGGKKKVPPTVDEVRAYCLERKNGIDPQAFVDFYEARGWKYGQGKPVVDWKACVRTWENRRKQEGGEQSERYFTLADVPRGHD